MLVYPETIKISQASTTINNNHESGWDWSEFLLESQDYSNIPQEWWRLVKLSLETVGIAQTMSGSKQDWLKLFVVTGWSVDSGEVRIGQPFLGSRWDWSNFRLEWAGLLQLPLGAGRICQTLSGSGWDLSNFFLWESSWNWSYVLWAWERFGENSFGFGQTFSWSRQEW